MGLFFFKNATAGGDWIIQERLENDAFVSSLLPEKAPLSTMRVISASRRAHSVCALVFSTRPMHALSSRRATRIDCARHKLPSCTVAFNEIVHTSVRVPHET